MKYLFLFLIFFNFKLLAIGEWNCDWYVEGKREDCKCQELAAQIDAFDAARCSASIAGNDVPLYDLLMEAMLEGLEDGGYYFLPYEYDNFGLPTKIAYEASYYENTNNYKNDNYTTLPPLSDVVAVGLSLNDYNFITPSQLELYNSLSSFDNNSNYETYIDTHSNNITEYRSTNLDNGEVREMIYKSDGTVYVDRNYITNPNNTLDFSNTTNDGISVNNDTARVSVMGIDNSTSAMAVLGVTVTALTVGVALAASAVVSAPIAVAVGLGSAVGSVGLNFGIANLLGLLSNNSSQPLTIQPVSNTNVTNVRLVNTSQNSMTAITVNSNNVPSSVTEIGGSASSTLTSHDSATNTNNYNINIIPVASNPSYSITPNPNATYTINTSSGNSYNYNPSGGTNGSGSLTYNGSIGSGDGDGSGDGSGDGDGDGDGGGDDDNETAPIGDDNLCSRLFDECYNLDMQSSCSLYDMYCLDDDNNETQNYQTFNDYFTTKKVDTITIDKALVISNSNDINSSINKIQNDIISLKNHLSTSTTEPTPNIDLTDTNEKLGSIDTNINNIVSATTNDNISNFSLIDSSFFNYSQTIQNFKNDMNTPIENINNLFNSINSDNSQINLDYYSSFTDCTYSNTFVIGNKQFLFTMNPCEYTNNFYNIFYFFVYFFLLFGAISIAFTHLNHFLKEDDNTQL